jgi:hypothetical protein
VSDLAEANSKDSIPLVFPHSDTLLTTAWILDFGFWIGDCGLGIADFGFWILDFGFWIVDRNLIPFPLSPFPSLIPYGVHTSLKLSQILICLPPNPQFWGSQSLESPPELGDLGGE